MSCDYFARLWDETQRAVEPTLFSVYQRCPTSFPRLELYLRREPPMYAPRRCKCGNSEDAWHCWNKTKSLELMGERRR